MRQLFVNLLRNAMENNPKIVFMTADLGYGLWEDIEKQFPDRFINCGSSEQLMTGMAVGACLEGKIPIIFSITSFLLYRPFEILRTYINHEKHPVKLIGANRDYDYKNLGISHYAHDAIDIISTLKNIEIYYPQDDIELENYMQTMIDSKKPCFLSLKK